MAGWTDIGFEPKGDFKIIDQEKLEKEMNQQVLDYTLQLETESKSLEELIQERTFEVVSVLGTSNRTSFTPNSEVVFGGKSTQYQTGYTSGVVYGVKPVKESVEPTIRSILFKGAFPPIFVGHTIAVQIPIFEEKSIKDKFPFELEHQNKKFYLPRECKKQEKAIEILILDPKHNYTHLGTFRSVDYCDYFPKN